MIVRDFMTKNPIYTNPKELIANVKSTMDREQITKVPVLDDSGKLIGVITKTDLKKTMPSNATTLDIYELSYLLSKITVEKVMKKQPITIQKDATIEEAAKIMSEKGISSLIVMDGEVLSGILTKTDLFRAVVDMFGFRYEGVRAEVEVSDNPGELAKISKAIADAQGKIVSVITADGSDVSKRIITLKIIGISKETVEEILKTLGADIKDLR
ncbi:MAG: CBS and ACT domain-containing protein [Treponema sp.]|uniref:CBS and ACT domain-containing protein n=1 Tax=Treponema sp. TaxID=166 RepID=UPI002A91D5EC|nr:CBS and ACT domain-containing protein [Treponema sp.]MDY6398023.1 CBS and ACT domain-containing protein [Treponema sp.]